MPAFTGGPREARAAGVERVVGPHLLRSNAKLCTWLSESRDSDEMKLSSHCGNGANTKSYPPGPTSLFVAVNRAGLACPSDASLSRLGSSQSRVAKMEAGDPTVSMDLLVRSLIALGADSRDIAMIIAAR
jgi:hypothetical protein